MSSIERCDEILRLIDEVLDGAPPPRPRPGGPDRATPILPPPGRPLSGQGLSSARAASLLL